MLQFLKGAPADIRATIYSKAPKDLVAELEEELVNVSALSREAYQTVERKVLNRMKVMANEGLINLVETNERMLAENGTTSGPTLVKTPAQSNGTSTNIKKVAGW